MRGDSLAILGNTAKSTGTEGRAPVRTVSPIQAAEVISRTVSINMPSETAGGNSSQLFLSQEDKAMDDAQSTNSIANIPMLVTWLGQNITEEPTAIRGLKFMLNHLETGEGCAVLMSHNAVDIVMQVQSYYKTYPDIQLNVLSIFDRLLACNYTRAALIDNSVEVLRLTFSIGHRFMYSLPHVEAALRCVLQCARSEVCRADILQRNLLGYCTNFVKRYSRKVYVVRSVLKLFNWVATDERRMKAVCKANAVDTTLRYATYSLCCIVHYHIDRP
jgi:hypothetical protein